MTTSTKQAPATSETTNRSDFNKVKVGDTYSRSSHGVVIAVTPLQIEIRNQNDNTWKIDRNIVEYEFTFANEHHEEASKEVTGTEAIEILKQHSRTAMTVCFNKKPDPKETAAALKAGQGSDTDKAWNAKVKKAMEGEERKMIGYHLGNWTPQGHLQFFETGKGIRAVDPRTLNWIVCEKIKYVVK